MNDINHGVVSNVDMNSSVEIKNLTEDDSVDVEKTTNLIKKTDEKNDKEMICDQDEKEEDENDESEHDEKNDKEDSDQDEKKKTRTTSLNMTTRKMTKRIQIKMKKKKTRTTSLNKTTSRRV
jgi:CO dehydrogenase/acetyl-CoA synthase beta subunit